MSKEYVALGTQIFIPSWAFSADTSVSLWCLSPLGLGLHLGCFYQLNFNHRKACKDLEITIVPDTGYSFLIIVPQIPFLTSPIFFVSHVAGLMCKYDGCWLHPHVIHFRVAGFGS